MNRSNVLRRKNFIFLIALIVLIGATVLYAQINSLKSPAIAESGTPFDEAALLDSAFEQMRRMGISGETEQSEIYFITYGQWNTLNNMVSNYSDEFPREMPIYVYKATGKFQLSGMQGTEAVAQERIVIALFAETGQLIGMRSFGNSAEDLFIDVNRPDDNRVLIPSTLIPLDKGEPTPLPYPPVIPEGARDGTLPLPPPVNP